jgi:hypothetical protein
VHRVSKFDLASMTGNFNSFSARFRKDYFYKTVSEIDAKKNISSPGDLYGKSFPCLSMSTFEKCRDIHDRTLKMLSPNSHGHTKTNLDQMHMDPGVCWMLVSHL